MDQLIQRMNAVDLSGYSYAPTQGEKAVCWHLLDMELSPINIMSRVNWHSQSIRITDGKTLCFLNLKHIKNFHFRTRIGAVWDFLQSVDSCAIEPGSPMKIEYIRRFFMESGVFRSTDEIEDPERPQSMFPITLDMPPETHGLQPDHFIVLPICEMDGNVHIALVNRDFAYSKYLATQPGPVTKFAITLDMANGIKTHQTISGRPFGSSLNFFAAALDSYKRNPCLHYLDIRGTSYPVPLSQFFMAASPYFPELQIIWVSHSIALTPGVDAILYRASAHLEHQAKAAGYERHAVSSVTVGNARKHTVLKNKAPTRLERRQAQYDSLFKKYNVKDGAAPHVSNFNQMIFSLRGHSGHVGDKKPQSGMQSFLDKKMELLGVD